MIAFFRDKRIGVLCGGFSSEREVSFRSGTNVHNALLKLGYSAVKLDPSEKALSKADMDVAFIALHGHYGEDGCIQGYLESLRIPYTGSGVLASAIGMNKALTKQLLLFNHLPTLPFYVVSKGDFQRPSFPFPLFAKPTSEGSSVGGFVIDSEALWKTLPDHVATFGDYLLEPYLKGQEITVGVLHEDDRVYGLPILELAPTHVFYDYEAKYTEGLTRFILPANLSPSLTQRCQDLAIQTHKILGCRGMSRIDMIVDAHRGPFILEANTIPGMTDLSDLPAQARHAGLTFEDLVEIILKSAQ